MIWCTKCSEIICIYLTQIHSTPLAVLIAILLPVFSVICLEQCYGCHTLSRWLIWLLPQLACCQNVWHWNSNFALELETLEILPTATTKCSHSNQRLDNSEERFRLRMRIRCYRVWLELNGVGLLLSYWRYVECIPRISNINFWPKSFPVTRPHYDLVSRLLKLSTPVAHTLFDTQVAGNTTSHGKTDI